jgi:outer membrane receptor protein involved in Fe transport
LNLIWDSAGGRYTARLYASNLSNSDYLAYLGAASTFGARYVTWAPPRQVGGEIRVRF